MRPQTKTFVSIMDTQATAGETNTYSFDRKDYDYANINLSIMGTETTDPPTVMHLTHSDDNTTFATFTGFTGGTDFTIPTAIRTLGNASQGPTIVKFRANLQAAKRYVKVTCNAATKMTQVVNVELSNPDESPENATAAGVAVLCVG